MILSKIFKCLKGWSRGRENIKDSDFESCLRMVLDHIISPSQAAFGPDRGMCDNIIISHELMHHINKKKGKLKLMAIKGDRQKLMIGLNGPVLLIYDLSWLLRAFC